MNNALIVKTEMDVMSLGDVLVKSEFFSDSKSAAQAVVKVLAGQELGFGPIASMTGIFIVKGHVTLSANLLAAAIKRSGKYNYRIRIHTDECCKIEFFEGTESIGFSEFTMVDVKRANLTSDTWTKYPKNMLFARALSNGAKFHCADVFGGPVYTPDELGMEVNPETGEIIEGIFTRSEPTPENGQKPDTPAEAPDLDTYLGAQEPEDTHDPERETPPAAQDDTNYWNTANRKEFHVNIPQKIVSWGYTTDDARRVFGGTKFDTHTLLEAAKNAQRATNLGEAYLYVKEQLDNATAEKKTA